MPEEKQSFQWSGGPKLVIIAVVLAVLGRLVSAGAEFADAGQMITIFAKLVRDACYLCALVLSALGLIRWALRPYLENLVTRHERLKAEMRMQ